MYEYAQKDLEKAINFATEKHKGQQRKDGSAYIYHPLMTAAILKDANYGYEYQIAATLHDILEDTETTEEELSEFGEEIVEAVKCLTRPDDMNEEEYVEQVLSNRIAAIVKSADQIHNVAEIVHLNPAGKRTSDYERERKYKVKAQRYLAKAERFYAKRFMPEVDHQIASATSALNNIMMPDQAGLAFRPADMRLYSDIQAECYEFSKDRCSNNSKPDFSRNVLFLEDGTMYYCIYEDEFSVFKPTECWCLYKEGWIPTSYEVYEPDDVTFYDKEWMKKHIEYLRKEGYFYDFVEFPLIPD